MANGQTVNIMTLGGLALAVGILVDEATVTIENIHTHLADGRTARPGGVDATTETTLPRLLAMLCILAVFIPAFFMDGAAHVCSCRCRWRWDFRWSRRIFCPARWCRSCPSWLLRKPHHARRPEKSRFSIGCATLRPLSCAAAGGGRIVVSLSICVGAA